MSFSRSFPLLVLNLDCRKERWERTLNEFARYGVIPDRVNATNGWNIPREKREHLSNGSLTGGEIGCLLSHLTLYKLCLEKQTPCVWVCEDNVELIGDISLLPCAVDSLSSLDPLWDLLYTDCLWPELPFLPPSREKVSDEFFRVYHRLGTHSLILSSRGLQKITSFLTPPFSLPIDRALSTIPTLKVYALTQSLTKVSGIGSDTSQEPRI